MRQGFDERTLRLQHRIALAALAASWIVVWRTSFEPFMLVKATAVHLAAVAVLLVALVRLAVTGRVVVPRSGVVYGAAATVVAMVVATATSSVPALSVAGVYGRFSGLALYGAAAVLLLAVARTGDGSRTARWLVTAVALAGGTVGAYALLQAAGVEPFDWVTDYGDATFSFLGNPNFAAATMGIAVPAVIWFALDRNRPPGRRGAAAVGASALVVAIITTESVQGLACAAVGGAVLAVAWALDQPDQRRRAVLAAVAAAGALAVAVGAAAVLRLGAGDVLARAGNVDQRSSYWAAAVDMFLDHPVTGVGLDMYASHYREHRPLEAALELDVGVTADAPHNVVLNMFASGGVVLGLPYLAFLVLTGWALVSGLRTLRGRDRLLVGAVGGVWAAYQVQSMVSIDVPSLAVVHWISAGGIVALRAGAPHVLRLPWAPTEAPRGRGRPKGGAARHRSNARARPAVAIATLVGVVAAVLVVRPVQASVEARTAEANRQAGELRPAFDAATRAIERAPWRSDYWSLRATILYEGDEPERALADMLEALEREPRDMTLLVNCGRIALDAGDVDRAGRCFTTAVSVEPQAPELLIEVAEFEAEHGDADRAVALAEQATGSRRAHRVPDEWWTVLGDALTAAGDTGAAADAYAQRDEPVVGPTGP